ncbi:MAG: hypothetical protein ACI81I_000072 [Arcobacteraceae bacterium]|jgi:hypothetical protein
MKEENNMTLLQKLPKKYTSICKNYLLIIKEGELTTDATMIIDTKNNKSYMKQYSLGNIGKQNELLMFTPKYSLLGVTNIDKLEYRIGINPNGNTVLSHSDFCNQNLESHTTVVFDI